ncbi:MAG: molybdopterin-dependent oxidoreductase [Acidimicrobiales bacterium]
MADEPIVHKEFSLTRRALLTAGAVGGVGLFFGRQLQSAVGAALSSTGSSLANFLPGGDQFRIYTVTNGYPSVSTGGYQLALSGLFTKPVSLDFAHLEALGVTKLTADFQCVTGWRVPKVPWAGVRLSTLVELGAPDRSVKAFEFYSYDGVYTESLTYDQAMRRDVLVATRMFDQPISREHGGPVRLYVAPMYGYKSIKWLSQIRAVDQATPGYWEQQGYAVNAWIGRSNGRTDPPVI